MNRRVLRRDTAVRTSFKKCPRKVNNFLLVDDTANSEEKLNRLVSKYPKVYN